MEDMEDMVVMADMYEYDEECLQTFILNQGQLFDEPVAETGAVNQKEVFTETKET